MKTLLQPFFDIKNEMNAKYGISKIPYYVCVGQVDEHAPVRSIDESISYYGTRKFNEFEEFYVNLLESLNNGFIVDFDYEGSHQQIIFAFKKGSTKCEGGFTDDKGTSLFITCEKTGDTLDNFLIYCNFIISKEREMEETKRKMQNIQIRKINLK